MNIKFTFIIFLSFMAHAECEKSDPLKAADRFYKEHSNFSVVNPLEVKDLITQEFFVALKKEFECAGQGELCAIETDPWTGAQDGEVGAPISFQFVGGNTQKASVKMNYTFVLSEHQKTKQFVVMKFTKSLANSCWLLSDLVMTKSGSLLESIEEWHKEYGKAI